MVSFGGVLFFFRKGWITCGVAQEFQEYQGNLWRSYFFHGNPLSQIYGSLETAYGRSFFDF